MELSLWCLCDLPASSNCLTLFWMTAILSKDTFAWQPSQLWRKRIVSLRVGVKPRRVRKKREITLKIISLLLSCSLLPYQDFPRLWGSISILNMLAATAVFATAILIIPKPRSFPNLHWEGLVRRDASTISKCSWEERWGEGTHLPWYSRCPLKEIFTWPK